MARWLKPSPAVPDLAEDLREAADVLVSRRRELAVRCGYSRSEAREYIEETLRQVAGDDSRENRFSVQLQLIWSGVDRDEARRLTNYDKRHAAVGGGTAGCEWHSGCHLDFSAGR